MGRMKGIYIGDTILDLMMAAAIDSWPKEASGHLLGFATSAASWAMGIFPFQQDDNRSANGVNTTTSEEMVAYLLEDHRLGGFHSHTNGVCAMSPTDKIGCRDIEAIVSIRPGKRKPWLFEIKVYQEIEPEKWRRMEVIS